ncbi:chemotaxis protein CheW [Sulfurimonas sp. RIFOXYB12_FULL_35_9]|uniref:chemotaxis protein CheW n=1 Tax=Sulfurimonas sp. RIFOXYB12_FULL_35_9 TaxID=1802256 RepID=UPI000A948B5D|nr:chemotaxis protein CheW [Sulfurimonas sp. RIFOXYB12_FULL_35_9]
MSEQIMGGSQGHTNEHQYLTFYVQDEQLGIGILAIKEIIEFAVITKVPQMSRFVLGITNVRGNVIPVIDLSDRLGLGVSDVMRRTCIVIVEVKEDGEVFEIGLLIDAVNQVYDIYPTDTEDTPNFGSRIRKDFIKFMGKVENQFIAIISIERLLSIRELANLPHN